MQFTKTGTDPIILCEFQSQYSLNLRKNKYTNFAKTERSPCENSEKSRIMIMWQHPQTTADEALNAPPRNASQSSEKTSVHFVCFCKDCYKFIAICSKQNRLVCFAFGKEKHVALFIQLFCYALLHFSMHHCSFIHPFTYTICILCCSCYYWDLFGC